MKKKKQKGKVKEFKEEFKKTIKNSLIAAFGFLIALVWRDLIIEYVNKISENSPLQGKLISALVITFICVLGILMITKFLSEEK